MYIKNIYLLNILMPLIAIANSPLDENTSLIPISPVQAQEETAQNSNQQETTAQVSPEQDSDQQDNTQEIIAKKLENIATARPEVISELRRTLLTGRKAKLLAKGSLGRDYKELKKPIKEAVDAIIKSDEFLSTVRAVADHQVQSICEENIPFSNIAYTPSDTLISKVNSEIQTRFPNIDEQTTQLFNLFYIIKANEYGCRILLDRLDQEEKSLKGQSYSITNTKKRNKA